MKPATVAAFLFSVAGAANADVVVAFDEGAPKDSFTISNTGACALDKATVVLDLSTSPAGLIFDVTGAGAGVSVYQPLELVSGQEYLEAVPRVRDGENRLAFSIAGLAAGGSIAFTIDIDDTAGVSETMVSGTEISGARVIVEQRSASATASFGEDAIARVPFSGCNA